MDKRGGGAADMDTSSISSLGELNAMLRKRGKENRTTIGEGRSLALSKATKSTAAMSNIGGAESFHRGGNQMSTIQYGAGGQGDESSIYNMRGESALGGNSKSRDVLSFPYMCDETNNQEEL